MDNFWPTCLRRFEKELSTQQFNTWIKPLIAEIEGNVVRLVAPNRFVMQWVKERFLKKIDLFATESGLDGMQIELVLSESDPKTPASITKNDKSPQQKIAVANVIQNNGAATLTKALKVTQNKSHESSGLNPAFNFDNYVTGRANQLARAAAIQVAQNPGTAYNPLFIYGGVGLGKTHLLQAIGNELKQHNPDAKIRYLHAERYVSAGKQRLCRY